MSLRCLIDAEAGKTSGHYRQTSQFGSWSSETRCHCACLLFGYAHCVLTIILVNCTKWHGKHTVVCPVLSRPSRWSLDIDRWLTSELYRPALPKVNSRLQPNHSIIYCAFVLIMVHVLSFVFLFLLIYTLSLSPIQIPQHLCVV